MKKQELITMMENKVKRNAYAGRIFDELQGLGFDVNMMKYERDVAHGKAFGIMECLMAEGYKKVGAVDEMYEVAVEEATQDIQKANYNIVKLLDMAGFDGENYYKAFKTT